MAQHPSGASLHLAGEADAKQLEAALHQVREAWRQQQFKSFLDNPRREAVDAVAAGVQYDAAQSESARKLFDAASSEERGVMLGASFSLAAYEKVFDGLPKHAEVHAFCPFCKCAVVPSWKHLAWDCCHFAEDRGSLQKPACPLSWRLGWPQVGEKLRLARSRLQFLARVRAAVRGARLAQLRFSLLPVGGKTDDQDPEVFGHGGPVHLLQNLRTECVIDTVQAAAYLGQAVVFLYTAIDYDGLECPNNSPVGCAASVAGFITSISWIASYLSFAANACGNAVNNGALCAGDFTALMANFGEIATVGAAARADCNFGKNALQILTRTETISPPWKEFVPAGASPAVDKGLEGQGP